MSQLRLDERSGPAPIRARRRRGRMRRAAARGRGGDRRGGRGSARGAAQACAGTLWMSREPVSRGPVCARWPRARRTSCRWAAGPLGRWAAGPLGRWAAGIIVDAVSAPMSSRIASHANGPEPRDAGASEGIPDIPSAAADEAIPDTPNMANLPKIPGANPGAHLFPGSAALNGDVRPGEPFIIQGCHGAPPNATRKAILQQF